MKILNFGLDNSVLNPGSPLAQRMRDYGDLVERYDVIVPNADEKMIDLSPKVNVTGVAVKNKTLGFFSFFRAAQKKLKKERYNLITVQDQYYLALIGLIFKWRFGIPLHIQIHGWEKFRGLRAVVAKFVLPKADAVRTVSERLKKQLVNEFGVKKEKITVVPMHVDIANNREFKTNNREFKNEGKFIFLTIGRLVPVKNIEMQIEAMAEVVKRLGTVEKKLELWIIWGGGSGREKLEMLIEKYKLEGNVKMLGRKKREELDDIYPQADAFLLTSWAEGWPLVIIEAAGFGLPIIMTDVGSAGEFIINGENGIVIPVGDKEKLAEAMIRIVEDGELRKKLGRNARETSEKLPGKGEILRLYKESWEKALIT